jgi:DNA repair protein RadC
VKPPAEFKVMRIRDCAMPADLVDTPDRVFDYWKANVATAPWFDPAKEAFVILILNTRRRILGHNLVALGGLDNVAVHPREVFRPAIVAAGSAIILAHNHPSLDPSPSEADLRVTRDLVRAGQLLKIEILDHVIIGSTPPFTSLRSLGYFH